ncbi:MAG: M20/M25/M40 family metallo-hydrolase [Pseudoclavibacter sp.]|nr:M20/M25/M40 family metallo-hydrolase [Pseudoclavibacter sp.]
MTALDAAAPAARPDADPPASRTARTTPAAPPARPAEPGDDGAAIAARLAELVRIPTVSAYAAETGPEPFERFAERLRELYPLVHERLEHERFGGTGLLYRWPAEAGPDRERSEREGALLLMAHYDVVPAEPEGWTHPPFSGTIAVGAVHGRGTLDDKGALVAVLEAVERLLAEGASPARDSYLFFTGTEETDGADAAAGAELLRGRGFRPWLVLDEGGAVVDAPLPFLEVEAAMIGVAEKGSATIRLEAEGAPGHASAPAGPTAAERIARAVRRLRFARFPARMQPAVRRMLRVFLPHTRGTGALALRALTAAPGLGARLLARRGGDAASMVRTTLATTVLRAGTAVNVLPANASAVLNLRIAPGETVAGALRRVRRAVRDREVRVRLLDGSEPTGVAPVDDGRFAALRRAGEASYPGVVTAPYIVLAATDARRFQRYWAPCYRFAPLRMTLAQRASVHGVDEHVTIDSLERGAAFHRALLTMR